MRFLSPDEIARLAAIITPRYRSLVLVGAYGGLRIGVLAGLRRGGVDVLRPWLDVAEKIVEVRGELLAGAPETRAGRRQWHADSGARIRPGQKPGLTCGVAGGR